MKYSNDLVVPVSVAGNIVQGVLNFFLIKKHLNGRKPKKIQSSDIETAIQNQNDEVIKVPKILVRFFLKTVL